MIRPNILIHFVGQTEKGITPSDIRVADILDKFDTEHGRSGKDIVDHPSRENDDLTNALAGLTLFVKNENSFLAEAL